MSYNYSSTYRDRRILKAHWPVAPDWAVNFQFSERYHPHVRRQRVMEQAPNFLLWPLLHTHWMYLHTHLYMCECIVNIYYNTGRVMYMECIGSFDYVCVCVGVWYVHVYHTPPHHTNTPDIHKHIHIPTTLYTHTYTNIKIYHQRLIYIP